MTEPIEAWRVIPVGQALNPDLTEWCVFHPPGPPNSGHPHTTDRVMAERIAALLNWHDYRLALDGIQYVGSPAVRTAKPEGMLGSSARGPE